MDWPKRAFKQLEYLWMWLEDHVPGVRRLSSGVSELASNHPSVAFGLVILALTAIGLLYYEGATRRCPKCRRMWAGTALGSSAPEPSGSSFDRTRPFVTRTTELSRMTTRYRCRRCGHLWSRSSTSTTSRYDFDPHEP